MIAFNTNHLLRHLLQDDTKQGRHVAALVASESKSGRPILLMDLVLMETCWVLIQVYKFEKFAWIEVVEALLADPAFTFESRSKLRSALDLYRGGRADFSDYLILTHAKSCNAALETFDKKLKRSI